MSKKEIQGVQGVQGSITGPQSVKKPVAGVQAPPVTFNGTMAPIAGNQGFQGVLNGPIVSPRPKVSKDHSEYQYLNMLKTIIENGERIPNRTGIDAFTIPHMMFQHDMSKGFPLLTTKKMAWKTMKVELEGFIKGITDKKWFKERGCNIWNEWCNPQKVPNGLNDEERKKFQLEENDLGPIYGAQWRNFNNCRTPLGDQLKNIVNTLKTNPNDRRLLVSSWNPFVISTTQALPPCHVLWNITVVKDKLSLCFFMRSLDVFLGAPFNISSYATLLHLLAKESGLKEGMLTGFFANCHVYVNHLDAVKEQLSREPYEYPTVETPNFTSIFDWDHTQTNLVNYNSHPSIKAEIAV